MRLTNEARFIANDLVIPGGQGYTEACYLCGRGISWGAKSGRVPPVCPGCRAQHLGAQAAEAQAKGLPACYVCSGDVYDQQDAPRVCDDCRDRQGLPRAAKDPNVVDTKVWLSPTYRPSYSWEQGKPLTMDNVIESIKEIKKTMLLTPGAYTVPSWHLTKKGPWPVTWPTI